MSITKITATVEATNIGDVFTTQMKVGDHITVADEPLTIGGKDAGPSPAEYLCMALASCTAITLRMYLKRKDWKVDQIKVNVSLVKAADAPSGVNTFYCRLDLGNELTEEQHQKLIQIADACPLHRLLGAPSEVVTEMAVNVN